MIPLIFQTIKDSHYLSYALIALFFIAAFAVASIKRKRKSKKYDIIKLIHDEEYYKKSLEELKKK